MVEARRALGVIAVACLLAVTGCTGDAPAAPSPTPTPAAPTPTPTETSQERQQRLDYAAAEKSYRTFRAEYNRVLRAGGAKVPTKVMKETAAGSYLDELAGIVEAYDGVKGRDIGKERIVYIRASGYSETVLLLDVCEDGRSITTVSPTRRIPGEIRTARLDMHKISGEWKIWSGSGRKVSSCD